MAHADFFSDAGRDRIARAIEAAEAHTSAELVVQVKPSSGRYREADYLVGASLAMLMLLGLLYAPFEVLIHLFPLFTVVAFVTGAAVSSFLPSLRRLFLPGKEAERQVYQAARAAFHDLRIARTSGRWGVLVLVSALERRAEVVTDLGIDAAALGAPWSAAREALGAAAARGDLDAFAAALDQLGRVLGSAIPHRLDDVDELPNRMAAAEAGDGAGSSAA